MRSPPAQPFALVPRLLAWGLMAVLTAPFAVPGSPTQDTNTPAWLGPPLYVIDPSRIDDLNRAIEQVRIDTGAASRQIQDQTRQQAEATTQRIEASLTARMDQIERSLADQHQRGLEALQHSNRTLLLIAGLFAVIAILGILVAAVILVRAMNRLSEATMALPLGRGPLSATLVSGELPAGGESQAEKVNLRFIGAIERLEKRIRELEMLAQSPVAAIEHSTKGPSHLALGSDLIGNGASDATISNGSPGQDDATAEGIPDEKASAATILLGKSQVLLNLGKYEDALVCLDQVVEMEPQNADALVKRGMVLERLQKMEEALDSYDRAIATNSSLTLAYLYKGAVCNRLQRFREALECYEKALKTEQKPIAS